MYIRMYINIRIVYNNNFLSYEDDIASILLPK